MTDNPTPNDVALREAFTRFVSIVDVYGRGPNIVRDAIIEARAALAPGRHDGAAIPAGMKPWTGGDSAPADWDGGPVQWGNNEAQFYPDLATDNSLWAAPEQRPHLMAAIIAYTPKPSIEQARAEGERVRLLINQVEAGQFDELDAVADKWAAEASVQRMANAMASVFENHASQEIMNRFREKLAALMHLAFVEGAAQGVLQLRATPKPSTEQARAISGDQRFTEKDLGWNVPANLRWLADQPTRPDRVPCGALTGVFLNEAATMIEGLAAENFKLKAGR